MPGSYSLSVNGRAARLLSPGLPLNRVCFFSFVCFLPLNNEVGPFFSRLGTFSGFDPLQVPGHQLPGVTRDGRLIRPAQGFTANNLHLCPEFIDLVTRGRRLADLDMLAFCDPYAFVAETLNYNLPTWEYTASHAPFHRSAEILGRD